MANEKQKLLLILANSSVNEDINSTDQEALLIYIFFNHRKNFDLEVCMTSLQLSQQQLLVLQEILSAFLLRAEAIGYGAHVNKVLDNVKSLITKTQRILDKWKKRLQIVGSIFLISWILFPFKMAIILACVGPIFYTSFKDFGNNILCRISSRKTLYYAKILRRINFEEVHELHKWAENHLKQRNFLSQDKQWSKETEEFMQTFFNAQTHSSLTKAYQKWDVLLHDT